jgi:hypothetical protein
MTVGAGLFVVRPAGGGGDWRGRCRWRWVWLINERKGQLTGIGEEEAERDKASKPISRVVVEGI